MAKSQERGFDEKLNNWVQTAGIILAAAWGIYAFTYKEIWIPKSAPVNITLDMAIEKKGAGACLGNEQGQQFDAIEMKFSAQNPSQKTIFLLPNKFIAYGFNVMANNAEIQEEIPDNRGISYFLLSKNYTISNRSVVAAGDIIHDFFLKPGEHVKRSVVFFIPKGKYDALEVIARIPTTARETKEYELKWKYNKNNDDLEYSMWHVFPNGKKEELKKKQKPEGGFQEYPDELDWQYFESCSMHSLW